MTALPGLALAEQQGLAAAGLGGIGSSLYPSEALQSIWDLLLVNFGPQFVKYPISTLL